MKEIYDNIHGYIKLDNIAISIIDTEIFKRLKNLKQLGNCHYVFPGAQHTRFEHSIGVYFLAGKVLEEIKKNQPEIELNEKTIELVKIAGLVHDLGHGPFSHLYDDLIINNLIENGINLNGKSRVHEYRSCLLLDEIIKNLNIKYSKNQILFIKSLICPKYFKKMNQYPKFLYQIISNEDTSLDVDKFDYLKRDPYNIGLNKHIDFERLIQNIKIIDNEIYYPNKISNQISEIFEIRFKFFRDVYNHHTIVAIDYMIADILTNIGKHIDNQEREGIIHHTKRKQYINDLHVILLQLNTEYNNCLPKYKKISYTPTLQEQHMINNLNYQDYHAIVLAVAHDNYRKIKLNIDNQVVFDVKSILEFSSARL